MYIIYLSIFSTIHTLIMYNCTVRKLKLVHKIIGNQAHFNIVKLWRAHGEAVIENVA